ncbi:unnamed protein product [Protopolystoma xenopodis]|uniref:BPTI/Kunitz inhibitor domain-containing protein n=1 Tax=Protopolystoma xenopodis TaxID=117903 RepID=A0A3S5A359_9PLAT|nr:unnamed protein product [Protopolystoma xenopodis]
MDEYEDAFTDNTGLDEQDPDSLVPYSTPHSELDLTKENLPQPASSATSTSESWRETYTLSPKEEDHTVVPDIPDKHAETERQTSETNLLVDTDQEHDIFESKGKGEKTAEDLIIPESENTSTEAVVPLTVSETSGYYDNTPFVRVVDEPTVMPREKDQTTSTPRESANSDLDSQRAQTTRPQTLDTEAGLVSERDAMPIGVTSSSSPPSTTTVVANHSAFEIWPKVTGPGELEPCLPGAFESSVTSPCRMYTQVPIDPELLRRMDQQAEETARRQREEVAITSPVQPHEPPRSVLRSVTHWLHGNQTTSRHVACSQLLDHGKGPDEVSSWYFDRDSGICRWFGYRGYGGNSNRFYSRLACETLCILDNEDMCQCRNQCFTFCRQSVVMVAIYQAIEWAI